MFRGRLKREILSGRIRICTFAGIFFLILLVVHCIEAAHASSSRFDEANRLYEERKYPQAVAAYQTLITNGATSAELLFNLGNAHFKNGEIGRAIFRYRQAASLAPRDPDIQANLRFARDSIGGSNSISETILHRAATIVTLNELSITAAIFLWLWLTFLVLRQLRPVLQPQLRTGTTIAALLFLVATCWLLFAWAYSRQQIAIVVAREAIVHLGPLDESQTAFSAPDGTEMRVIGRRDKWLQVSDRQNRVGWVKTGPVILFPKEPKS
jgi:tetratricopeptide (TPR) repeat protein